MRSDILIGHNYVIINTLVHRLYRIDSREYLPCKYSKIVTLLSLIIQVTTHLQMQKEKPDLFIFYVQWRERERERERERKREDSNKVLSTSVLPQWASIVLNRSELTLLSIPAASVIIGSATCTCTCNACFVYIKYSGVFVNEIRLKVQYKGNHERVSSSQRPLSKLEDITLQMLVKYQ